MINTPGILKWICSDKVLTRLAEGNDILHEQDLHLNDVPDEIIDVDLCYIQKVVDPGALREIQEKGKFTVDVHTDVPIYNTIILYSFTA